MTPPKPSISTPYSSTSSGSKIPQFSSLFALNPSYTSHNFATEFFQYNCVALRTHFLHNFVTFGLISISGLSFSSFFA